MVDLWNVDRPDRVFWRRFLPNRAFRQRLRHKGRYTGALHQQEGAKFAAAFYDWEKKEKDGRTQPATITTNSLSRRGNGAKRLAQQDVIRTSGMSATQTKQRKRKSA